MKILIILLLCPLLLSGVPIRQEPARQEIRNQQEVDLYISIIMQMARHSNPEIRQISVRILRTMATEYSREKILTYLTSLLELERDDTVKSAIIRSINDIMQDVELNTE